MQVSPSATRTTLTKGDNQQATKAFFRVVPADDFQGSTDAKYMTDVLKVKNVVIFDFQEPYSLGLGGEVEKDLKAAGVTTSHQSVANTVTDFSSFVTKVPSDADIVFFPTQSPGSAEAFAEQLVQQGKKAKVFGGDGSNGLGEFKAPGSYISSFAPSITGFAADKAIIAGWQKDNKGKPVGSFGPAAYGAVQVILAAAKAACTKGGGTHREALARDRPDAQGAHRQGLDPRRQVRVVEDQHARSERHEVLHPADPGRRLVQAHELGEPCPLRDPRAVPGSMPGPPSAVRLAFRLWTPSPSSRSTA